MSFKKYLEEKFIKENFAETEQQILELPVKYTVNKTYDIVDEESAEQGDFADSGFEYENQIYDSLEELLQDNRNESWIGWSSSHPTGRGEWITSEGQVDYRTGETTSYGLHIKRLDGKNLSQEEISIISKYFGIRV